MPHCYHLSLLNDREIHVADGVMQEAQLGSLISAYLNIDWGILHDECISFYRHKHDSPALSVEFATWYRTKVAILEKENPAIKVLVHSQLPRIMKTVLCDAGNYMVSGPEWTFVNNVCKDYSCSISSEYIRTFAQHIALKLAELLHFQKDILVLVELALDCTKSSESLLSRYIKMRSLEQYQVLASKYYLLLSPEFLIDNASVAKTPDQNTKSRNSVQVLRNYFASDYIESLVLWEFDHLAAQNISLRRCDFCGKFFRPFSQVSLYCNRIVDGSDKTCKQLGAQRKYQQKTEHDAARKLYRKVNNRLQMWVSRKKSHKDFSAQYHAWQFNANTQLYLVKSGQLTYEEFATSIDQSPKTLFPLD